MYEWLIQDLSANKLKWIIVCFHHPPYSKGHDSDAEKESIDMRQHIVPVLEQYGVDMVLNGHSHVYERSYLLKGHYGFENSLQPSMILDNTSGKFPSPYIKSGPHYEGTVYIVAGSSGKPGTRAGSWPHDAMYFSDDSHNGSLVIDIDQNLLTTKFIDVNGSIIDEFSIQKQ
jgi:3',5'-cyclic AMP phosphodiesterase CpdA